MSYWKNNHEAGNEVSGVKTEEGSPNDADEQEEVYVDDDDDDDDDGTERSVDGSSQSLNCSSIAEVALAKPTSNALSWPIYKVRSHAGSCRVSTKSRKTAEVTTADLPASTHNASLGRFRLSMNPDDLKRSIIYEVQKRPFLYVSQHPDHDKRDLVSKAWEEIGLPIGLTKEATKKIWQQIRGYANAHRDQLKQKPSSGSGSSAKSVTPRWAFAADVEFLLPHLGVSRKSASFLSMMPNIQSPAMNASGIETNDGLDDRLANRTPPHGFSGTHKHRRGEDVDKPHLGLSGESASFLSIMPAMQTPGLNVDGANVSSIDANDWQDNCVTSRTPPHSYAVTHKRRRDEDVDEAMIAYIKGGLNETPIPDHIQGWVRSVHPLLKTLDARTWMNFMADCNALIMKYMDYPPGPHFNSFRNVLAEQGNASTPSPHVQNHTV